MDTMEMNFCRRCGATLTQKNNSHYVCTNGHNLYVNAAPTVGIFFLTTDNQVLLSVRGIEPFKGSLDSFGGFVDNMETVEDAAVRELQEELGLNLDDYEPLTFLSTETGLYPYDGEKRSILGTFFWSRLKPGVQAIAADDVASIEQVPLAEIDFNKLDNGDVKAAIRKLQELFL
jgi:ADP-ribose pyrophosphatase YjhB (NUDIX family)